MTNKFNLTREENIFIARRNRTDYIYKSAKLEGMNIAFSEVMLILDGITAKNISVNDIITIHNLKRAWEFILTPEVLSQTLDYTLASKVSSILGSTDDENLSDTIKIHTEFSNVLKLPTTTERAIACMLYLVSSKMFGNKNLMIAMLLANKIIIADGAGILSIPINLIDEFKAKLKGFQHSKKSAEIADLLYENCIDGIHLNEDDN